MIACVGTRTRRGRVILQMAAHLFIELRVRAFAKQVNVVIGKHGSVVCSFCAHAASSGWAKRLLRRQGRVLASSVLHPLHETELEAMGKQIMVRVRPNLITELTASIGR